MSTEYMPGSIVDAQAWADKQFPECVVYLDDQRGPAGMVVVDTLPPSMDTEVAETMSASWPNRAAGTGFVSRTTWTSERFAIAASLRIELANELSETRRALLVVWLLIAVIACVLMAAP